MGKRTWGVKMNLLFTICGRAGSKGIKNKNIRNFLGYPLPCYTLSAIDLYRKSGEGHTVDVVVNSDSSELLSMMRSTPFFELEIIEREKTLGGDQVPKPAVILDCMRRMQGSKGVTYDIVIDLDITSPLRTLKDISNLIDTHSKTGADVTTSVTDARRNPYFNMVKKTDQGYKRVCESDYVARQQAPELFDMNASLYAYNPGFLLQGRGVLDGYCECIRMYDTGILDLDHENDFELMEVIAEYLYKAKPEFGLVRKHMEEILA